MNTRFTRLVAGTLFLGATAFATPSVLADEHTPFGAYLYEGTCDDVANATMVTELASLQSAEENEDIAEQWQTLNLGTDALPRDLRTAEASLSEDVTVETLLDGSHVVAVHAEESSDSDVIVCGEISGDVDDQGLLFIDLEEVNDSNYEGRIAFSTETDDDSDMTIGAFTADEAQELATPEGTPGSTPVATPSS